MRTLDPKSGYNRSAMYYEGKKAIQLSIGLKELNSYLILGQLYFKFMNDMNTVLQEITDAYEEDKEKLKNSPNVLKSQAKVNVKEAERDP